MTYRERLTEAVAKQLGDNDEDELRQTFKDLEVGGADAGWPGFCYTSECVEFYDANEDDIWEALREDADDFGHASAIELVATFHRGDMLSDPDTFKNLLAWYALESVARWVEDALVPA